MILLRNLALFFVVFLPAACATGAAGGFFVGPVPPPRFGYPMAEFWIVVLPLLMPALLAVPVVHFAQRRWLRDQPPRRARIGSVLAVPPALLAAHLAAYGFAYWSVELFALFALPGALYGWAFRR